MYEMNIRNLVTYQSVLAFWRRSPHPSWSLRRSSLVSSLLLPLSLFFFSSQCETVVRPRKKPSPAENRQRGDRAEEKKGRKGGHQAKYNQVSGLRARFRGQLGTPEVSVSRQGAVGSRDKFFSPPSRLSHLSALHRRPNNVVKVWSPRGPPRHSPDSEWPTPAPAAAEACPWTP